MSNKAPKQSKQKKSKQKARQTPPRTPLRRWLWGALLGTCTIVGCLVIFLPRVAVSAREPVDSAWPLTAPLTVRNTGFIPLEDVSASLAMGQMVTNNGPIDRKSVPTFGAQFALPGYWTGHYLSMDESFEVVPDTLFHFPNVTFADIALTVTYRPWLMPFHREKTFRFTTVHQGGHIFWISDSLGRPALGPN